MKTIMNAIIGSDQSKYVAISILITVTILCLAILFMESDVSIGKRLIGILFILLMALPGTILSLVELTCIVTGGRFDNKRWWCSILAWVIAVIVIIYCATIIVAIINSLMTYKEASVKNEEHELNKKATVIEANNIAEDILYNTKIEYNDNVDIDVDVDVENKINNEIKKKILYKEQKEIEKIQSIQKKPEMQLEHQIYKVNDIQPVQPLQSQQEVQHVQQVQIVQPMEIKQSKTVEMKGLMENNLENTMDNYAQVEQNNYNLLEQFKNKKENFGSCGNSLFPDKIY